ncbi:proteoglycan 4-like [Malaya genurostris]|uniref:proteoglycan 4-like n=1 Tax=Malaya genurostris TaxID=325434 RepID=UPI0026F3BD82|nr:proteoglycan 4-like [Malaya genurostris]
MVEVEMVDNLKNCLVLLAVLLAVVGAEEFKDKDRCKGLADGTLLPDPENCRKYYECKKEEAKHKTCAPKHKSFDYILLKCVDTEEARCYDSSVTTVEPTTKAPEPSCDVLEDGTRLPDPDNCRKYYECKKGKAKHKTCSPKHKSFDYILLECVDTEEARCYDSSITTVEPTTKAPEPSCDGLEDGTRLPDPDNCRKYYECKKEEAKHKTCAPKHKSFDYILLKCVDTEEARCYDSSVTTVEPTTKAPEPSCDVLEDGTRLPDPDNCRKYYECKKGKAKHKTCSPKHKSFDYILLECVDTEEARCYDSSITTVEPTTKAPEPSCDGLEDGTRLPDPDNCRKYYECKKEEAKHKTCAPKHKSFDYILLKCVDTEEARCYDSSATTPEPSTTTTDAPAVTTEKPTQMCEDLEDGTRLPDPEDCRKYYECKKGKAKHKTCSPKHKSFDYILLKCVDTEEARCYDSSATTPEPNTTTTDAPTVTTEKPTQMCEDLEDGTRLPDPEDCRKYYECKKGKAKHKTCSPKHKSFDYILLKCVDTEEARCYDSSATTPEPNTTTTDAPTVTTEKPTQMCEDLEDGTRLPDPEDCRKYYECKKGKAKHKKCTPKHKSFDYILLKCVDTEKARCYDSSVTTVGPNTTTTTTGKPDTTTTKRPWTTTTRRPWTTTTKRPWTTTTRRPWTTTTKRPWTTTTKRPWTTTTRRPWTTTTRRPCTTTTTDSTTLAPSTTTITTEEPTTTTEEPTTTTKETTTTTEPTTTTEEPTTTTEEPTTTTTTTEEPTTTTALPTTTSTRPPIITTNAPTPTYQPTCGDDFSGLLPHPKDCTMYYVCHVGEDAILMHCIDGYIFYVPFGVCLPGDGATCELHHN